MNRAPQLSLSELQHAFAQWRQTKRYSETNVAKLIGFTICS